MSPGIGNTKSVYAVAITSGGGQVISSSKDQTLRVWSLSSANLMKTISMRRGTIHAIANIAEDLIVVGVDDGSLDIVDTRKGIVLKTLKHHRKTVSAIATTVVSGKAVSASHDRTLAVWDIVDGDLLHVLEGHSDSVTSVAITPNGNQAVSASHDGTLKVWNINTGALVQTIPVADGSVFAVAISPNGAYAVSGDSNRWLVVWHLESGSPLRILEGHGGAVYGVGITPDGRFVVSASEDKTLKIWNLPSADSSPALRKCANCLATFSADSLFSCLAISPDSRTVVAGDVLGNVHFLAMAGVMRDFVLRS